MKCPKCGSRRYYLKKSKNKWICRGCNYWTKNILENEVSGELEELQKIESIQEKIIDNIPLPEIIIKKSWWDKIKCLFRK